MTAEKIVSWANYPRVTQILGIIAKPELMAWYAKNAAKEGDASAPDKIRDAAATRGTNLHKYVEAKIKGQPFTVTPAIEPYTRGINKFLDEHKPIYSESEQPVWSDIEGYRGTLDAVAVIGGVSYVLDYKTGSSDFNIEKYPPHKEHRLQLEAYRRAWKERKGVWIDGVAIVRLGPGGTYKLDSWISLGQEDEEAGEAWEAFLAAKRLFDWCEAYKERSA